MDNDDSQQVFAERRPQCRFGPDRRLSFVTGLAAVVALLAALLTDDPAGRLLFGIATVVLAAYVLVDVTCWPRLAADANGVVVRSPFARTVLRWHDIDTVRADVRTRHGIRSTALEIDTGERLIVFSRRALGADPEHVADVLRAFDPR